MDLQLGSVNPAQRRQLSAELEKADEYLKALGVTDTCRRMEILNALAQAARQNVDGQGTLILENFFEQIDRWASEHSGMPRDEAIVAIWLERLAEKEPDAFLRPERPSALRSSLRRGPELALTNMAARPIDFGVLPVIARDTRKSLQWVPLLRAVIFWALVYLAIVFGYPRLFPN